MKLIPNNTKLHTCLDWQSFTHNLISKCWQLSQTIQKKYNANTVNPTIYTYDKISNTMKYNDLQI